MDLDASNRCCVRVYWNWVLEEEKKKRKRKRKRRRKEEIESWEVGSWK